MPQSRSDDRFTRVAAYGVIVDGDRILLCRLSWPKVHAGRWTLPGGGLDFGEPPQNAMVREVREETGLEVVAAGLLGVDSICAPTAYGDMHGIRIVYRATVVGGSLRNEVDGSTDLCQWWPRHEIPHDRIVDLVAEFLPRAFVPGATSQT